MAPREADDRAPGPVEATALAVAGPAFALSLLFLRSAMGLSAGVFDAGAAVLVAMGVAPWTHRLWGPSIATSVRGAGFALGTLLLTRALVAPFYAAVWPILVAIVAGTLLQANARRKRASVTLDSLGVAALGLAFALGLLISGDFPEPGRLRLTLLLIVMATIAGLALRRFAIERGAAWLAPMPVGILLVSTLGGAYLSYRSLVREHVANLPLYEWTLAAGVAGLLLARLRRRAKEREVADGWSGTARRHTQDVRPVYDERMGPVAAAVGRYLEQGSGYEGYHDAMTRLARGHDIAPLLAALPREAPKGRAAKKAAAQQRLAAHRAIVQRLAPQRGPSNGSPQPAVRSHP